MSYIIVVRIDTVFQLTPKYVSDDWWIY